ncbi:MAG: RadC family protein [Desulfovibrio sp.]|nr:RadC family protein [Desulfovibrio sp.]
MTAKTPVAPASFQGHRARLRERLETAPEAVADYEVLELLLGYCLTRKDTKPLAKEMLQRFGSMRGALDARPDELMQVPGFGPGLLSFWKVLREMRVRHAASDVYQREVLATPEAVARMAQARLSGSPHEECWLALVDSSNRLIAWKMLRRGGIANVSVSPRDVLEAALVHKASGIIMVHNHPGGSSGPSASDRRLTEELESLAPHMGLRFLDHVIVTDADCYSMAQSRRI